VDISADVLLAYVLRFSPWRCRLYWRMPGKRRRSKVTEM
jgi:hypothetical protein